MGQRGEIGLHSPVKSERLLHVVPVDPIGIRNFKQE